MLRRCFTAWLWIALSMAPASWADAPPYPADMPLLTILDARGQPVKTFTLQDLEALPGREVGGPIPDNSDPASRWYGVSLKTLLAAAQVPLPDQLLAGALNDYSEIIPVADIEQYDPVVAYRREGHYLPVQAYGPLMLMYPYASHPELFTRTYYNRTVWQLDTLRLP